MAKIQLLCYHSTSYESAQNILREMRFNPSHDNGKLRLGAGAYFFVPGTNSEYAITCARELERYHFSTGKHGKRYSVLSCKIECDEEYFLDLCDPDNMETYHNMRYQLLKKRRQVEPDFKYDSPQAIDAYVLNIIRNNFNICIVKCQQYFGMMRYEEEINCKYHQKTLVPNVIMACADPSKAIIKEIEQVDEGEFSDEVANCV